MFLILLNLIATIRIIAIDATQQNDSDSTTQIQNVYTPENIYQPSAYEMNISPYVPWNSQYEKFSQFEINFVWTLESMIWKATNIYHNFLNCNGIESLTEDIVTIEWWIKNNFTQVVSLVNRKALTQFNNFVKQSNVVICVLSKASAPGFDQMYWCQRMMSILIDLSSSKQQTKQLHFAVAAMVDAYICKWYQIVFQRLSTSLKMTSRLIFTKSINDKVLSDAMQWYYDYIFHKYIFQYQISDKELLARLYHLFLSPFIAYIRYHGSKDQVQQYHMMRLIILQELTQYCLNKRLVAVKHANVSMYGQIDRNVIEREMDCLLSEILAYIHNGSAIVHKWINVGFAALESNRKMFWLSLL